MLQFSCPSCKDAYQIEADLAGSIIRCRSCHVHARVTLSSGRPSSAAENRATKMNERLIIGSIAGVVLLLVLFGSYMRLREHWEREVEKERLVAAVVSEADAAAQNNDFSRGISILKTFLDEADGSEAAKEKVRNKLSALTNQQTQQQLAAENSARQRKLLRQGSTEHQVQEWTPKVSYKHPTQEQGQLNNNSIEIEQERREYMSYKKLRDEILDEDSRIQKRYKAMVIDRYERAQFLIRTKLQPPNEKEVANVVLGMLKEADSEAEELIIKMQAIQLKVRNVAEEERKKISKFIHVWDAYYRLLIVTVNQWKHNKSLFTFKAGLPESLANQERVERFQKDYKYAAQEFTMEMKKTLRTEWER